MGSGCAAEMLLLIVARQCGSNKRKWLQARDLGIPWQRKRWTSLTDLQREYNDAVRALELRSCDEDAALFALLCSKLAAWFMHGSECSIQRAAVPSSSQPAAAPYLLSRRTIKQPATMQLRKAGYSDGEGSYCPNTSELRQLKNREVEPGR